MFYQFYLLQLDTDLEVTSASDNGLSYLKLRVLYVVLLCNMSIGIRKTTNQRHI